GSSDELLAAALAGAQGRRTVAERLADGDAPVDLLVNSAGVLGRIAPLAEHEPDEATALLAVNITALTELTRAAVSAMSERRGGGVINVSSFMGYVPAPQGAVYAAAKAFATSFSESVHCEVARHGVNVTALCPGSVRTGLHRGSGRSGGRLGRFLDPGAVADAGLAAVREGRPVCVPGTDYRVKAKLATAMPRTLVRRRILRIWRQ
ncbi:SDR family NAD(P)-dependent oxidoreductase, partial [Streptomonospora algeriensis]